MKAKEKKRNPAAIGDRHQKRVMRRFAPIFLLPMTAAFAIGFVWPFLQGLLLQLGLLPHIRSHFPCRIPWRLIPLPLLQIP